MVLLNWLSRIRFGFIPRNSSRRVRSRRFYSVAALESLERRELLSGNGLTANGVFQVPGQSGQEVELSFLFQDREAAFRNEFGIYEVDTAEGRVNGIAATDTAYAQTALTDDSQRRVFRQFDAPGTRLTFNAEAGDLLGLYLNQNLDRETFLAVNPTNRHYLPPAFFSVVAANPDQFDHVRSRDLGNGRYEFRWEDLTWGGDQDFNDIVVVLTATPTAPVAATPILGSIGNRSVAEETLLSFTASAADQDSTNSQLTYSLINTAPSGATINSTTGRFQWTPTEVQGPGQYSVTIRVADEGGRTDDETIQINVTESNRAPQLTVPDRLVTHIGDPITFSALATDTDSPTNTLTFSLVNAPIGASIHPVTGSFSWTPGESMANTEQSIVVRVTDNGTPNLSTTATVVIAVECTFDENLTGFTVTEDGGTPTGLGTVEPEDCTAILTEGNSFMVSLAGEFEVLDESSVFKFEYDDLQFDTTSTDTIRDAFEVAIIDADGNSLVPVYAEGRDAFFNVTEGLAVRTGAGVTVVGNVVSVPLNNVPAGTQARMIFRLVNNDSDTQSTVRVVDGSVSEAPSQQVTVGTASLQLAAESDHEHVTEHSSEVAAETLAFSSTNQSLGLVGSARPFTVSAGAVFVPPAVTEPAPLTPVVEWEKSVFESEPASTEVMMAPVVIDLDLDQIPEIIFATFEEVVFVGGRDVFGATRQTLRAIRGADGSEVWSITNPDYAIESLANIAVGDIDLDGYPEIIAVHDGTNGLIAFEHDGTFKWQTPTIDGTFEWGTPAIADINQDGVPEIILGRTVVNNDGTIRFDGTGSGGVGIGSNNGIGAISIIADIDLDGRPEIVAGSSAYRSDGSLFWNADISDGAAAVANFDNDPFAEIVVVGSGRIYFLEHDGTETRPSIPVPGGGLGGAPTVADMDGDGDPDIGVAGSLGYSVLELDGTVKWVSPTDDRSSEVTASSVFDFNGDGRAEVAYGDELAFRIYDGRNGEVLYSLPRGSGTTYELPVIADVDADGHAEIVVVANRYYRGDKTGIIIIGGGDNPWVSTRPIWNQHSYHITNINDDGSIPQFEANSWEAFNNYRRNEQLTGTLLGAPLISVAAPSDQFSPGTTVLLSGVAQGQGIRTSGEPNSLALVTVNGRPVDVLDAAGSFFTQVTLQAGANFFEFTATDAVGQTTSASLTLFGVTPAAGEIDLSRFADITASFSEVYGRTSFNADSQQLFVDLATRNDGQFITNAPLLIGVTNISNPSVMIDNADGVTSDGIAYVDFTSLVLDGQLQPGEATSLSDDGTNRPPTVIFNNPERTPFTYDLVFLGQLNQAPVVTSLPVTEALTGRSYTSEIVAVDPDGNALTFALRTAPVGMTIDPSSGLLSWTPTVTDTGLHSVVIQVADTRGGLAEQRFTLTVLTPPPNRPPVITSVPVVSVNASNDARSDYIYDVEARDADGDILTYRLQGAERPSGMSINATTGVIHWSPSLAQVGDHSFYVKVSDSHGGVVRQRIDICVLSPSISVATVVDLTESRTNPLNQAPEIGSAPVLTVTAGSTYISTASATDSNNDRLVFDLPIAPSGMSVNAATGTFVWIPRHDQVGSHQVLLRVRDGQGGIDTQSFLVQVVAQNTSPVFTSIPTTLATAGHEFRYRLTAQDGDGDPIQFAISNPLSGMSIQTIAVSDPLDPSSTIIPVYEFTWTPGSTQVGDVDVTLTASDGLASSLGFGFTPRGGSVTQTFTLSVLEERLNSPPGITSWPRQTASLGQRYVYQPVVQNRDGDPLTFSLVSGPFGMSMDSLGNLHWIPTANQVGVQHVEIYVQDHRDGAAMQSFQIEVSAAETNLAPVITSVPNTVTLHGRDYRYDLQAVDADRDPIFWSLATAPRGMSLDATSGTINWHPAADQLGEHTIVVEARDPSLAVTTQQFTVDVRCENTAPLILSVPLTSAVTDRLYVYPLQAFDFEGDDIAYSLVTRPAGMTIDPRHGLIRWLPNATQAGSHSVSVRVTDDTAATIQNYVIEVATAGTLSDPADPQSAPIGNRPPLVTSSPKFTAEVSTLYQYDVSAVDPDGDVVTFSLNTPPSGMSINATSGLITWTPTTGDVGERIINVVGTDSHGARATQSFLLATKINQPPRITSTAVTTTTAGATYRYTVKATDPDGDPLTFRLNQSPDGMTIDAFGRILWNTPAAGVGNHSIVVAVSDNYNQTVTQSFTLTVNADTTAPQVTVGVIQPTGFVSDGVTANIGSQFFFKVIASDNVGVEQRTLIVDGQNFPLDSQGRARAFYTATRLGTINVVATATDAAGNVSQDEMTVTIVDAAVTNQPATTTPGYPFNPGIIDPNDNQVPIVVITSPANQDAVTDLTPIIGTVDDPENRLWFYRVLVGRVDLVNLDNLDIDDPDWKLIQQSTSEVISGELAKIDPSMLPRDPYAIIVAAYDLNGQGYIQPTIVNIEGNVQLGNFHLDFTDLTIPLAGIPIQITRSYDTLNAGREKDFGFGWNLGIADARILETVPQNGEFVSGKTKVYLTNPDGKRIGFTYVEVPGTGFFDRGLVGDQVYYIEFRPDPGVTDKLESNQTSITRGGLSGVFGRIAQGLGAVLVNPNTYTLTRPDGTKFVYDQVKGLQTVTDLNGNVLTVTPNGITHSSGESIDFIRDGRGRITEVRVNSDDLNEHLSLHYAYDAKGDLRSFTNQIGQATRYEYRTTPAHYLDKVFDSRDVKVLEVSYNGDGTYRGLFDALGKQVSQTDFDVETRTAIVRDANGNATTLLYNDRGNVIRETDPLGGVTLREYSDARNPDLETRIIDRDGHVTDRVYDERGNLLRLSERDSLTDPLASAIVTEFTYDAGNHVTSITNALDNATTFAYDAAGNVTTITNAEGNSSSFTYDSEGHRKTFTDFNGNVTTFEYETGCGCGRPSKVIFADGTFQTFAYNVYGQVTVEEFHEANGTLVERTQTVYDNLGRVIEEKRGVDGDPNHPPTIVRKFYDGNLLDYEIVVNPLSPNETPATPIANRKSRITDYEYDSAGRVIRQIDAMGGIVEFRYDANGNRILLQDPVGNITTWVYDANNRIIEERDPFYWEDMTIAQVLPVINNSSGGSTATNTPAAHVRLYEFDGEGNQTEVIDRNGRRREFDYDRGGNLLEERWYESGSDALVRTITFAYDSLGNILTADDSDSHFTFTYDTLNRLRSTDNAGTPDAPNVILTYAYDAQGNVTSTTDNDGVTVASTYNERNLLETRTWFDAITSAGQSLDVDPSRVDFRYNAAGRESAVQRYSDLNANTLVGTTTRAYDPAGRSDLLRHDNAFGELLAAYDYDYDIAGMLTHEDRSHQDAQFAQSIDFRYDLTGQLIDAFFSGQADEHYEYDANGNRLFSRVGSEERTSTPDTANQLKSDGQYRYEYDGEGNQIKRMDQTTGETRIFEYDHRNRLVRVNGWNSDPIASMTPATGAILTLGVNYTYDPLGRRLETTADADGAGSEEATQMFFVSDNDNVWSEADRHQGRVYYLFGAGIDQNIARYTSDNGGTWYLSDRLQTSRNIIDDNGQLVHHATLSLFGVQYETSGAGDGEQYSFTNREIENVTGQYYYRARYYDPNVGRFVSRDPQVFEAGDSNLYRYVFNRPNTFTDPYGQVIFAESAILQRIQLAQAAIVRCLGKAVFTNLAEGGVYLLLTSVGATPLGPSNVYIGQAQDFVVRFSQHSASGVGGRGLEIISEIPIRLSKEVLNDPKQLRTVEQILLNAFGGKAQVLNKINATRKLFC